MSVINPIVLGTSTPPTPPQAINYTMLYDFGDECVNVTGGYSKEGYKWNNESVINAGTKNADNFYFGVQKTSTPTSCLLGSANKIDVTDYCSLYVNYIGRGQAENEMALCLTTAKQGLWNNAVASITGNVPETKRTLVGTDIASLNGSYYLAMGNYYASSATRQCNIYQVILFKHDNVSVLGYSTIDEALANANTILSNESLTEKMVKNCTGDFMIQAIQDSGFISALKASPYEDIVLNNVHWSKFLEYVNYQSRVYLYNEGDECVDLTGGWSELNRAIGGWSIGANVVKYTDSILITATGNYGILGYQNLVSLANYNKLCLETSETLEVYLFATNTASGSLTHAFNDRYTFTTTEKSIHEIDISSRTDSVIATILTSTKSEDAGLRKCRLHRMWLE